MSEADEETLNSIPDEAIVGTIAHLVQELANEGSFGLVDDEENVVTLEVGEVDISPMKVASFSLTAVLGDERRTWAVRIEAHE